MRSLLRTLGFVFLTLFSLDFIIWLLDYFARLDFIKTILENHPKLKSFVHTPYVIVVLLVIAFVTLYGQYKVRQPYILARYTNARLCPDMHSATMQALFDTNQKKPGWDTEHKFDWNWFVELLLVNDSDTPTTVHGIKVKVKAGGNWFQRLIRQTRQLETSLMDNVTDFQFYHREGYKYDPKKELPLQSLMERIRDKPLERGIGHNGWIGIHITQANQREMNSKPTINIWVVDAYGKSHSVRLRSRKDERKWDAWFEIVERVWQ